MKTKAKAMWAEELMLDLMFYVSNRTFITDAYPIVQYISRARIPSPVLFRVTQ